MMLPSICNYIAFYSLDFILKISSHFKTLKCILRNSLICVTHQDPPGPSDSGFRATHWSWVGSAEGTQPKTVTCFPKSINSQ